ncbi:MAG: hypothetical protein ACKOQ4_07670, partial [Mycobacterium sp.]
MANDSADPTGAPGLTPPGNTDVDCTTPGTAAGIGAGAAGAADTVMACLANPGSGTTAPPPATDTGAITDTAALTRRSGIPPATDTGGSA